MSSNGPPKGILKNRTSSQGSGDRNGRSERDDSSCRYPGSRGSSSDMGWGPLLRSPPSFPDEPRSEDLTGSLLRLDGGSDRASLRAKLHEFVSRKRDMLFRPLGTDEIPILERGPHSNTKDHFGVTPSLDFFLKGELSARRSHFFDTAQPGEIVLAELTSKTASGLHFNLLSMEGGRSLYLEELDIKGYCPMSQMIPAIHPTNPNKIFTPGDLVRCEILSVKGDGEKVVLGMKGNALSAEMKHSAELGLTFKTEIPTPYSIGYRERKADSEKNYEELLDASHGFHNPNGITCLASQMGILNNRNTLMTGLRGVFPDNEMAQGLRRIQNGKWAHGNVAEGIRHFKSGNLTEAFQCLNKAITIDAENVEGLVARGALYANKGGYEKAIEDFESALKYNPNHVNAKKYLAETLVALGKQHEDAGRIDEAVVQYGKCINFRPDHQDAKDAVWSIYSRYEKIDFTKLNPLQRGRALELREKLKAILAPDLKSEPLKGSKKKPADSSSDSDSSSSDSSSESGGGKKKKKKKKRKKKKSKSKKDKEDKETPRAPMLSQPLSPFSRRLAEGGMAPFRESTTPQVPPPPPPLDSDSKRKKERKRKKKLSSDSSSSSSSESDRGKRHKTKKKKKRASTEALGDLEAKLSAYFSKVEQDKIKEVGPPPSSTLSIIPPPLPVQVVSRDLNFTLDSHKDKYESRKEPVITRVLPTDDRQNANLLRKSSSMSQGKIELMTDAYGNFLKAPEAIVRTVLNSTMASHSEDKPKFEMKIRSQTQQLDPPAQGINDDGTKGEGSSKWRKVGDPNASASVSVVTRKLDGTEKRKKELPFASTIQPPQGNLYVPPPTRPVIPQRKEEERNYRKRSSRSRSRSTSSRSISRSPKKRGGRSRSRSRSARRSRSRTRSRSRGRRSRSRRRGRSRSPMMRGGGRGRSYVRGRFARGGGFDKVDRVRRVFLHDTRGGFRRGRGQFPRSRMRNVFEHSRSRSRSRSRRRSRSGGRKIRSRSKSVEKRSPEKTTKRDSPKKEQREATPVEIVGITTREASEVEKLLDQRKAEKKEEMKERNPEFFRNV